MSNTNIPLLAQRIAIGDPPSVLETMRTNYKSFGGIIFVAALYYFLGSLPTAHASCISVFTLTHDVHVANYGHDTLGSIHYNNTWEPLYFGGTQNTRVPSWTALHPYTKTPTAHICFSNEPENLLFLHDKI